MATGGCLQRRVPMKRVSCGAVLGPESSSMRGNCGANTSNSAALLGVSVMLQLITALTRCEWGATADLRLALGGAGKFRMYMYNRRRRPCPLPHPRARAVGTSKHQHCSWARAGLALRRHITSTAYRRMWETKDAPWNASAYIQTRALRGSALVCSL